ncbi:MAG: thioesterase family protein [Acidobacteria bacterium]|nr:thioesterase family protein [Acidobacteriota bacterium]
MARIRIHLPSEFPFRTELTVRISDINYGGHLGNDAVLSLVHEARLRFFATHGLSEMDVGGCGIIMVDTAVEYRGEGFHGDRLLVEVGVGDVSAKGCDVLYRVSRPADGLEIARAKTGIVFYDYERRKVVRMPPAFHALLDQ